MSIAVLTAVFERTRADGAAWQVLVALADWSDPLGVCWPTQEAIAKKSHVSLDKVRAALEELTAIGELAFAEIPGERIAYRILLRGPA